MGMMDMQRMDSLEARLDSLVGRMNRATGDQKVTAMAAVINEIVAQRKGMREHMRRMMESHGMKKGARRPAGAQPAPRRDSAATDSTNHTEHHPPD